MRRKRIVVAEDETDVAAIICEKLTDLGYEVECAHNGEDALRLALDDVPDLMISDIIMPRLNGEDLIKIMQTDARLSRVPCIMITAKIDGRDRFQSLGIQGFLEKPFTMSDLLDAINSVFNVGNSA